MIHRITILPILLLLAITGSAQKATSIDQLGKRCTKLYEKASKASRSGKTDEAIKLFSKLADKEPQLQEAYLSLGGLYYRKKDFAKSAQFFEQAKTMRDTIDPEIHYALATAHMAQDHYAAAATAFDDYLLATDSTAKRYQTALKYSANMHFAADATAHPVPFDPMIVDGVSSVYSEYMPVVRGDGQEMIFIRRTRNQEDLYTAEKINDTTFAAPRPIEELNTKANEGIHTLSADGKIMVFTACGRLDGYGQCDLYYTEKVDGKWKRPINMGKRINTASADIGPSLTADGRGLYFVSDRVGGIGGKDLYYTQLKPDGTWYRPVNLGSTVNTPKHEESPFIHQDGVTLYYRSNGLPGMGDYDIYYSRWSKEDGWSAPRNIGYPINTKGSEGALTVSLDGKTAYYASDRDDLDQKRRDLDIYRFTLPASARPQTVTFVSGTVTDASTGAPLVATLVLENLEEGKVRQKVRTDEQGNYFVALPLGQQYAFTAEQAGYLFYSENYQLDSATTAVDPLQLNIALAPVPDDSTTPDEISRPIILRNVFFETGSAALLPQSQAEINRLAHIMEDYPGRQVQIIGHTDNVGQSNANLQLSQERADAVKTALIEQGIKPTRIEAIGKGETQPIASNDTAEGRQSNRRVEFLMR